MARQRNERFGELRAEADDGHDRKIGGEEIGLLLGARGEAQSIEIERAFGPEDRLSLDFVLHEQVRNGNSQEDEQGRQHLIREHRVFFASRRQDAHIVREAIEIASEDQQSIPGSHDRQHGQIGDVVKRAVASNGIRDERLHDVLKV